MKRTTKTIMLAMAATVITGSAFAQTDSTKTDSTVVASDSTATQDKEKTDSTKTTPPTAAVSTEVKTNTYVLVATNKEMLSTKNTEIEMEETEA